MLPYIIIFLINLFFITQDFPFDDKKKNFFLLFLANTLFVGLRDMIGGFDVYIYSEIYEAPTPLLLTYEPFELGFRFLLAFLKFFSEDRHFMMFFFAALTFLVHYQTFKKYSPLLYFSAFIFFCKFFLMSFVYLRQETAMCLLLLSFPFIIKRQIIVYAAFILAAFFLHKSSIIFFPVYFLYNYNFNRNTIIFLAIITIGIAITPLSDVLLGSLVEATDDSRVETYFNKSQGLNIFYLIETVVLSYLLISFKENFDKVKHGQFFFNGFLFYILVTLLAAKNASFIRFSWYYIIFIYIGMAYIYTFIENKNTQKLFSNLTILYFSALFFRLLILYDDGDFMPYKMFFQNFDRNGMWDFMEYR